MPRTHLYMPGLGAYDQQSQRAAISEMYRNGNAGTLFVDTQEAKNAFGGLYQSLLESRLQRKDLKAHERVNLQSALDDRKEYNRLKQKLAGNHLSPIFRADIKAKMQKLDNIKVVDSQAGPEYPAFTIQQDDPDHLVILGHGSPNVDEGITTRMDVASNPQSFGAFDDVTVTKGRQIKHSSEEIAKRIQTISRIQLKASGYQALNVRMVACGGANTFRADGQDEEINEGISLIHSITDNLDALNAHPQIQVTGFMGDTNSSQPQQYKDNPHKIFTSRIKQRENVETQTPVFKQRVAKMRARANTDPLITTTPIIRTLKPKDYANNQGLKQFVDNFDAPSMDAVSENMQQRSRPFTRVTQTIGRKPMAFVPRRKVIKTEYL